MQKIELILQLATAEAQKALAAFKKSATDTKPVDVFRSVSDAVVRRPLAALQAGFKAVANVNLLQSLENTKQKLQPLADSLQEISALGAEFTSLDTATAKIRTLGGEAKAIAGDLQNVALTMASDFPLSASEIQNATYNALSAGIKASEKDIAQFMDAAAKLAVGGSETIDGSVDLLSSALNAYGLQASQTARVSDIFFQTVNLGKTTIPELNASLSNVIPTAAAAGVSLENVGASLAVMTANGIPTAQSTTKLNQLLLELQKPSATLAPILQKAGVSLESLRNEDLPTNLERVKKALGETGLEASQAFSSSEAGAAFNTLTKDMDKLKGTLGSFQGAAGATDAAYAEMSKSVENRTKQLKSQFDAFIASTIAAGGEFSAFGLTAAGAVGAVLPQLNSLISVANGLPGVLSMAGNAGSKAFSVLSSSAGVVQKSIATAVGSARASLLTLPPAKAIVGTAARVMWAAITGPIGLVVAGVAAVAAGFVALYNYFPPFKKVVDDVIGFALAKFEGFKKTISGVVDAVAGFLGLGEAKEQTKKAAKDVAAISDAQRAEQQKKDAEARKKKQADDAANAKATAEKMLREYEKDAPTLSDKVKAQRKKDLESFLDGQKGALLLSEKDYDGYYKRLERFDKSSKEKSVAKNKDALAKQQSDIRAFAADIQELLNRPVVLQVEANQAQLRRAADILAGSISSLAGIDASITLQAKVEEQSLNAELEKVRAAYKKSEQEAQADIAKQVAEGALESEKALSLLAERRAAAQVALDAEVESLRTASRIKTNEQILALEEKHVLELAQKGDVEQQEAERRLSAIADKRKEVATQALGEAGVTTAVIAQALGQIDALTKQALSSVENSAAERKQKLQDLLASFTSLEAKSAAESITLKQQEYAKETKRKREELQKQLDDLKASKQQEAEVLAAFDKQRAEGQAKISEISADAQISAAERVVSETKALFKEQTLAFKAMAIAQAIINAYSGAAAALAPPPVGAGPLFGPILAAVTIAKGLATVAQIAGVGFDKGGYSGDGHKKQVAGVVHKGEFIFTKENTEKNRLHFEEIHRRNITIEQYAKEKLTRPHNIPLPVVARELSNYSVRPDGSIAHAIRENTLVLRSELQATQRITRKAIAQFESNTKVDVSVKTEPLSIRRTRLY